LQPEVLVVDNMDLGKADGHTHHLDPHEKPPESLRAIFKNLKGRFDVAKASKCGLIDLENESLLSLGRIPQQILLKILRKFEGREEHEGLQENIQAYGKVYTSKEIPGKILSYTFCFEFVKDNSRKGLTEQLTLINFRPISSPFITASFQPKKITFKIVTP
jgi:hypothetical protein